MSEIHPYTDATGWCRQVFDPALTQQAPPIRVRAAYGGDGWLVTRHEDVRAAYADPRFSRSMAVLSDPPRGAPAAYSRLERLGASDPPEHTHLRRLLNYPFSAAGARQWQPKAEEFIVQAMENASALESPVDLMQGVLIPFSVRLMCEIIGIPIDDRQRLVQLMSAHSKSTISIDVLTRDLDCAMAYFDDLVESRIDNRVDDAISHALNIRDAQAPRVADADVSSMIAGMFATAVENLPNQTGIAIQALLSNPLELAKLMDDRTRIYSAVDELLRYAPYIIGPHKPRYATSAVNLGGVEIPEGDCVLPSTGAANFDQSVFECPYKLDLFRPRRPLLTFGFGIHFCQAAHFVRMVVATVILCLLERYPQIHITVPDEQLRWRTGIRFRSFEYLPVAW